MDDNAIIELFFDRSEQAIRELDGKYGKVCHSLSLNYLLWIFRKILHAAANFFEEIFRGQFPHPADDSLPGEEIAALDIKFSRR